MYGWYQYSRRSVASSGCVLCSASLFDRFSIERDFTTALGHDELRLCRAERQAGDFSLELVELNNQLADDAAGLAGTLEVTASDAYAFLKEH